VDVVAEDDGVLLPGFRRKLLVPFAGDNHRWMGPLLLPTLIARLSNGEQQALSELRDRYAKAMPGRYVD
jgi:hypothetical protein